MRRSRPSEDSAIADKLAAYYDEEIARLEKLLGLGATAALTD